MKHPLHYSTSASNPDTPFKQSCRFWWTATYASASAALLAFAFMVQQIRTIDRIFLVALLAAADLILIFMLPVLAYFKYRNGLRWLNIIFMFVCALLPAFAAFLVFLFSVGR